MSAETEPLLGDEDELDAISRRGVLGYVTELAVGGEEHDAQLVELRRGHGQLVEEIFGIVAEEVDGLVEQGGVAAFGPAIVKMFTGGHVGKLLVNVSAGEGL